MAKGLPLTIASRKGGSKKGVQMMRLKGPILLAGLALALSYAPNVASGQGKGGGKGQGGGQSEGKGQNKGQTKAKEQGQGQGQSQGRGQKEMTQQRGRSDEARISRASDKEIGNTPAAVGKGNSRSAKNKFTRLVSPSSMPQSVRRYATSRRGQDVIIAAAVSHAFARGRGDDFLIVPVGNGMRLANRNGDQLVLLDDESARNLGRWRVGVIDDDLRQGAPSFCRSGEGHPVWGRQWCLDKGFGLGSYQDFGWGHTTDLGDIAFSQGGFGNSLIGSALASVLGTTAFNRLALHAVTLGLVEPLTGTWYAEPTGPQLLLVNSGALPVAELVDVNRDNRADNMLVALRRW